MASISKRPDGRWRARYRDPDGKEHARHFDRKVDGERWLAQMTAALVTGQYVDPRAGRITFAEYFANWATRQVWETTTVQAMGLAARSATFADMPLGNVRRSHVEQWVKQMTTAGLAPGTIRTRMGNVRSVLRAALRDRVIAADPSEGVTLPRIRRQAMAMTLPTPEQIGQLLSVADGWFRPFLTLAAFSGLRLGEAAGLQLSDVDFLRRSLVVARQVQRAPGGRIEVRPPKYGSERVVFLADGVLEELGRRISTRVHGQTPSQWLFMTPDGDPPHQNTVGHLWRKACRDAGLSGITLHDCRHFYASGLIAAGCDVVTVQRALGHAKATTTLNTYAHLWPSAEDRTRRAAGHLMASVSRSCGLSADRRHPVDR